MTQPKPPASAPPKRRRWLRRVLYGLLILLVLVVVFHRSLMRFAVIQLAHTQHMAVDLHFSGTLFSNLTISGVSAAPDGTGVTPVEKITIERLRFEYSIPMLVRHGFGEFLRSYELHHGDLVFVALPSKDKAERKKKISIAELLRTILAQPAAYADRAWIDDFNVRVRAPESVTEVLGIHLLLDPEKTGHLRIARLAIPGVPLWENLDAETTYAKRNLFIKHLEFSPDLILHDINFDASERAKNKGTASLNASVFGGEFSLSVSGSQLNKKGDNLEYSYDTFTRIKAQGINVRAAAAYFGVKNLPVESLGLLEMEFRGEPEVPRTWDGSATVNVERIAAGSVQLEQAGVVATIEKGHAKATATAALAGNTVKVVADAQLPASINDFRSTNAEATIEVNGSQIANLNEIVPSTLPLSGTLLVNGTAAVRDRIATADLRVAMKQMAAGDFGAEAGEVELKIFKNLDTAGLVGLTSEVRANVLGLRAKTFTLDSLVLNGGNRERLVSIASLEVRRGPNAISARGTYELPTAGGNAATAPTDVDFTIKVPDLSAFGIALKEQPLTGQLNATGSAKQIDGALSGGIEIAGGPFQLGNFAAQGINAKVRFAENTAFVEQLSVQVDAANQLTAAGQVGVQKPFAYGANLRVALPDLTAFQPLLEVLGIKEALSGAVALNWAGKGSVSPAAHEGDLKLAVNKARYGGLDISEVRLAGLYGPAFAESTDFHITTGSTQLDGKLDFKDRKFQLRDINLRQGQQQALTGFILIPFDPANAEQRIPYEEEIAANVSIKALDLDKLATSLGKPLPMSGNISATLLGSGTLLNPTVDLKVNARALKANAAARFDGAEVDLTLRYAEKNLALDVAARQREIKPLTIKARVPLDVETVIKEKRYDPSQPIELSVTLPPTSLAAIPKFVPAVRRMDGTAALDFRVTGSLGEPQINGSVNVDLKGARMASEAVPTIATFRAKLGFARDTLNFNTFEGEIGGGKFKLGGNIKIPELADLSFGETVRVPQAMEPVFNLELKSSDILVRRDESVTIRADADLKLAGPLKAAAATGTVYIAHSRFLKEIDILPIALPGRPKPAAPRSAPTEKEVSFPQPPLRDWTFDIAIKTRENDPFLIRGNLANGAAAIDLRFGGTGLAPWLDGTIRLDQFAASLPFSTLSITRGFVYFRKGGGFMPSLDLQAESRVRDYAVGAYIYGQADNPQIQFTSEPPLPHADIVSLLATGTTTAELGQNATALASRAAFLAAKQLYQKMFKKSAAPAATSNKPEDNPLERFDFEVGSVNSRTGQQQAVGRFKINDQIYLVGDAGVDGQFTGRLTYLIRFR